MKSYRVLFQIIFISLMYLNTHAQQYTIQRGERPTVDISKVPAEAYEKDRILLKFSPQYSDLVEDKHSIETKNAEFVQFGIESIDQLNKAFNITKASQIFYSGALNYRFTEKHKAWGFHLWFEVEFEAGRNDIVQMVKAYEKMPQIEIAEPVYKVKLIGHVENKTLSIPDPDYVGESIRWTPDDPRYNEQWHYHNTGQQSGTADKDIDLPEAWDIEKGNSSVIVAIVDGGIQWNHPDLQGNMWSGIGYNFVAGNSTIAPHNHGTHVAGTVSAVNNNGVGVAGVAGGSGSGNGVRLMSCQVFTASSSGGFHLAPVYAADNGAAISQNSWGYTSVGVFNQNALDAIDYFNLNGGGSAMQGGITIFAAGNDNSSGAWYPGYYSGAFSVAATNNNDQKSWYSNYDTWIDISAPGGETNSVTARGVLSTITGSTYTFYQGTSMACPHVSGVAALILSLAYGELTSSDVADILKTTTDNHYPQNPGFIGKLGTGRLNAYQALLATQNLLTGVANPKTLIANTQSTSQININWTKNNDNHDVMLVWAPTGTFGIPTSGTLYSAGQTIPGGGTVLYRGSATQFNHTGLNSNTQYFYKAFSYNSTNEYSSGRETNATTLCSIFTSLPYLQDFNASASVPGCWSQQDNQGNGQIWQFGTVANGLTGSTGNYAFLNSDGYGSGNSQNADLISPLFDLSGYMNVTLTFKHYFRQYQSASTARLFYSIDGGTTWTQLTSWAATTANPATYNQTIEALSGQASVRFKWNYQGTYAYYWCVDDLLISGDLNIPGAPTPAHTPIPANLASGAALSGTLQWTWGNNTDKYDLWFGPTGNMQLVINQGNAGTSGTQGTYNYVGLNPTTAYQWQVISYNTSLPLNVNGAIWSFTTSCGTFNLPFVESFEDASNSRACWSQEYVTGSNNWTYAAGSSGGAITTARSGVKNARFTSTSGGPFVTKLVSPILNLSAWMNVKLSFWYGQELWSPDQNELKLYYRISPTDPWIQIGNTYNQNVATWTQLSDISLPNPSSTYQIAFEGIDKWGRANVLDDIEISGQPIGPFADFTANPLTAITGDPITFTDASGNGSFSSWNWSFGSGAQPASATGQGPHVVTYSTAGSKTISLVVNGTYSITKTDYVTIGTNPYFPPENLTAGVAAMDVFLSWDAPSVSSSDPNSDILDHNKADSNNPEIIIGINASDNREIESNNTGPALIQPSNSLSLTRNNVLYDNGPFINSPGTGPNGSHQSILQNTSLNMTTLGVGVQISAGNRMADDFVVTSNWDISSITVYAYQTGSTTTSTMTTAYLQIWNGTPGAGGQVIWGNLSTNRLQSTSWTNTYRVSQTTINTDRPIMQVVCSTPGLSLSPGTYWIDFSLAGSLSSGPWAPPITITGQSTTGNARQFTSSAWQIFEDGNSYTPQGIPFIVSGTAASLISSYKIYRNGNLLHTNNGDQITFLDQNLNPGIYTYHVTAMYGANESGPSNQVIVEIGTSCLAPTAPVAGNITHESASLSWQAAPETSTWDLKYGPAGFDPETEGTLISGITSNPYYLAGLTPFTDYGFHIRSVCSGGMLSNWSSVALFTTERLYPEIYTLSGGGTYCSNLSESGLNAVLSGSETTASYQLLRDDLPFGSLINGTGNPITWINLPFGTFRVAAFNNSGNINMNGQVIITEIQAATVNVTIDASLNNICSGTSVSFTANPSNQGSNPVYQWMVNGSAVGQNMPVLDYSPSNNDIVQLFLTSSLDCVNNNPAPSNIITMQVTPVVNAIISISAAQQQLCNGQQADFTAFILNGGTNPVIQWRVNSINVGTNAPSFSYVPANNDMVDAVLTSNLVCATNNPATSNLISLEVLPNVTSSVSIEANPNPSCNGANVTLTATPVNGGSNPTYQWKLNGLNFGSNSNNISLIPNNGDLLQVIMGSSLSCATGSPASSNILSLTVLPVELQLAVSPAQAGTVGFTGNPVIGQQVTLTANPANGWQFVNWTNASGAVVSSNQVFAFTIQQCINQLTANFSSGTSLSGKLAYFNPVESAMPPSAANSAFFVQLYDGSNPVGNPQQLGQDSRFSFSGLNTSTSYTIRLWEQTTSGLLNQAWTFNNWGGVTALDALIVSYMTIEDPVVASFPWIQTAPGQAFSPLFFKVADANNSNGLTALDALLLMFRSVGHPGTSPFPGGRPDFQLGGKIIPSAASFTYPLAPDLPFDLHGAFTGGSTAASVYYQAEIPTLQNGSNFLNLFMIATGDMNASMVPSAQKSAPSLQYNGVIGASMHDVVHLPVFIDTKRDLAAFSLSMKWNPELVEVSDVKGPEIFAIDAQNQTIKIAWMDKMSRTFGPELPMAWVELVLLKPLRANDRFLELLPETELADVNAQPVKNVAIGTKAIASDKNELFKLSHLALPNPFNESTAISFSLPAQGNVTLSVFNALGQQVHSSQHLQMAPGENTLLLSKNQLTGAGAYSYQLMVEANGRLYMGYGKIILSR